MDFFGVSFPEISTANGIALAVVLLFYLWYRRPKNFPPGPRGLPFVGVLHLMGKFPERRFRKWSEKYGPIMSVRMGRKEWVVLNDYESISEALVKQKEKFSGRPNHPLFKQITGGHGIVFMDYNMCWKSQRKFDTTTLRGFGVGKKSMEERVSEEVHYLCDEILQKNGQPFNILKHLTNAVANNICSIVFGNRYEYSDEEFAELVDKMEFGFVDNSQARMIRLMLFEPRLMKLPLFFPSKDRFVSDLKALLEFLKVIITKHKISFDPENLRDYIDAFIANMGGKEDKYFTDKQLLQCVRDLFVAGTETTTNTIRWAILVFLHYPETQNRLFEEITMVIGMDRRGTMSDKANMPYTSAFIEEVFRFRTMSPLSLHHNTTEDAFLNGYFIPRNTRIVPNIWAVHNDPNVFPEPDKFNPARYLNDKGQFIKSKHVIPFSLGPRHCLGEQLARMEIFIFIVSLVQKFDFHPDPTREQFPEIVDGVGSRVFVPLPYSAVAKERS